MIVLRAGTTCLQGFIRSTQVYTGLYLAFITNPVDNLNDFNVVFAPECL
jgi:hypothetical protein